MVSQRQSVLTKRFFLVLAFFLLAWFFFFRVVIDPDLGWHLRVGEYVFKTRTIPQKDFLSFSMPDHPYVYHSWLSEVILYFFYRRFGLWGVSFFYSTLTATIMLVILEVTQERVRESWAPWFLLVFMPLIQYTSYLRPQLFTLLGLAFLYLAFRLYLKKGTRLVYLLPLVFIAWPNLHGGFFLGLLFFLSLLLVEIASFLILKVLPLKAYGQADLWLSLGQVLKLGLIFCLSLAAGLVNPYGYRVYRQAFLMGTNQFAAQFNLDWYPLVTPTGPSWLFAFLLMGTISLMLIIRSRVELREKLMMILFLALSLKLNRFSLPLLVVLIPAFIFFTAEVSRRLKKILGPMRTIFLWAFLSLMLTFFAPLPVLFLRVRKAYTDEAVYAQEMPAPYTYPYGAVKYIRENLVPERILNDYNWGGYLVWQLPERKFFIDGRMDNFFKEGKTFAETYWRLVNLMPGWDKSLEDYRIEAVLISKDKPLAQALAASSEWQLLFEDDNSVLFERKKE